MMNTGQNIQEIDGPVPSHTIGKFSFWKWNNLSRILKQKIPNIIMIDEVCVRSVSVSSASSL